MTANNMKNHGLMMHSVMRAMLSAHAGKPSEEIERGVNMDSDR